MFCRPRQMSRAPICDIVFPVSQRGNCLARCLRSSPAPRNRRESHTVTMLFTQLLLSAGSLRGEHQHTLISSSHSNTLRGIKHTHRVPESQSARLGDSTVGEGIVSILSGRTSGARWAAGQTNSSVSAGQSLWWPIPRDISVAWSSALVCGARLWSGACLSYTLKVLHPSGSF